MKNVLIITSSFRRSGNSNALADEFARGARENGNNVEVVSLIGRKIGFCCGCLTCQKTQKCVIEDDVAEINEKLLNADVVVFATPVYYYSVSGQLKTVLDRANPLYTTDYKFREVYLLAAAAEDEETTVEGSVKAVQGWVDCFERAELVGTVFAGGVNDVGDIAGHKALTQAYELGKSL